MGVRKEHRCCGLMLRRRTEDGRGRRDFPRAKRCQSRVEGWSGQTALACRDIWLGTMWARMQGLTRLQGPADRVLMSSCPNDAARLTDEASGDLKKTEKVKIAGVDGLTRLAE